MTEEEWLAANNPFDLLKYIENKMTDRKLRLFSCSCCRKISSMLTDVRIQQLLITCEAFADGISSSEELDNAICAAVDFEQENSNDDLSAAHAVMNTATEGYIEPREVCDKIVDAYFQQLNPIDKASLSASRIVVDTHLAELAAFAHDVFGNPFRPVILDSSWLTSTVFALAQGIYTDRAFDRMPILADALQDAGCENEDILNHCRSKDVHVRGCWVVDLILGKE